MKDGLNSARRGVSTFHLVEHLLANFYPTLIATPSTSEASIKEVSAAACAGSTRESTMLATKAAVGRQSDRGALLRHQFERMRQARALIGPRRPFIGRFGMSLVCRLLSTPKCLTWTFAVDPYLSYRRRQQDAQFANGTRRCGRSQKLVATTTMRGQLLRHALSWDIARGHPP